MMDGAEAGVALTALENHRAVIVTRNVVDMQALPIPALPPAALLSQ